MTTGWLKSSACNEADCVEVRSQMGSVEMRASQAPEGPVLRFTSAQWNAFLEQIRVGEFDDLA